MPLTIIGVGSDSKLGESVRYLEKAIYNLLIVRRRDFAKKCDALFICCSLSLHFSFGVIPPVCTMAQDEWYEISIVYEKMQTLTAPP